MGGTKTDIRRFEEKKEKRALAPSNDRLLNEFIRITNTRIRIRRARALVRRVNTKKRGGSGSGLD